MLGCQPPCRPSPRRTGSSTMGAGRRVQASSWAASASQGRDANEQNVSAMRGSVRREPPASNRPARDQHGDNQARRLRQPAVQRRQRQSAIGQQHRRQRLPGLARVGQAQQQAVPDEELQQHRGVAQRRDDDGRQPRRHRLGRQARQAQRHAQQRGQGQGGQRHRQRVDQAGRQRHPVGILGQHVEQAFRDAKARGLEQEAEAAVHAARGLHGFDLQGQQRGQSAQAQDPGQRGGPAARRGRQGERAHGAPRPIAPPARAGRRQRASLERRRVQQAALVPLRVQAALSFSGVAAPRLRFQTSP